jgi:hypothetical protein
MTNARSGRIARPERLRRHGLRACAGYRRPAIPEVS